MNSDGIETRALRTAMCGMAVALLAGDAWGVGLSVMRARNNLPLVDSIDAVGDIKIDIGLRGASHTGGILRAHVGVWEPDSDDRRGNQRGFDRTHPSLIHRYAAAGIMDFAADGNVAPMHSHPMWVGGIINALAPPSGGFKQRGMAYRANGSVGLFDDIGSVFYTGNAQRVPSLTAPADWAQTKAAGDFLVLTRGVHVMNGSWGLNNKPNPAWAGPPNPGNSIPIVQGDLDGSSYGAKLNDKYSFIDGVLVVMAAGNTGTGTGLLSTPADHFNGLSVGALVNAGPNSGTVRVANYSSRLPLANNRNGVHLVAPGTGVFSTGHVHGNMHTFTNSVGGTSFATPHVSGAAAILYSAGLQAIHNAGRTDHGSMFSVSNMLLKSVLINSATKIPGAVQGLGGQPTAWTPGMVDQTDATRWLRPLNYVVGSGELNTLEAWKTYREQHGAGRKAGAGATWLAQNRWWTMGTITSDTSTINFVTGAFSKFTLADGHWINNITATLTWFRHVTNPANAPPGLSDLDLYFEYSFGGDDWTRLLGSVSTVDSTEHVFLANIAQPVAPEGDAELMYRLRVHGFSLLQSEQFALAVRYTTVPTPGGLTLLSAIGALCVRRRRA